MMVTIAVAAVNDAPTAADDAYATDEDVPLTIGASGVLSNDVDVDGDRLTASVTSGAGHGSVELGADGSFTYTPDHDFNGTDSFSYRASDGSQDSATATVDVELTPVDEPPVVTAKPKPPGGSARDAIDCGPGRDVAIVDRTDRTRRCEQVRRG